MEHIACVSPLFVCNILTGFAQLQWLDKLTKHKVNLESIIFLSSSSHLLSYFISHQPLLTQNGQKSHFATDDSNKVSETAKKIRDNNQVVMFDVNIHIWYLIH